MRLVPTRTIQIKHIRVMFFTERASKRVKTMIDSIVSLVLACFTVVVIWQIFLLAMSLQSVGSYEGVLHIPTFYRAYFMAFAFIPILFVFLLDFWHSYRGKELK